jgi:hypothetical protein
MLILDKLATSRPGRMYVVSVRTFRMGDHPGVKNDLSVAKRRSIFHESSAWTRVAR